MRETWYRLEDGRAVSPAEVSTREDGRLVHESGALVALRGDVPASISVDLAEMAALAKASEAAVVAKPPAVTREMDIEKPSRGYSRRGNRGS